MVFICRRTCGAGVTSLVFVGFLCDSNRYYYYVIVSSGLRVMLTDYIHFKPGELTLVGFAMMATVQN